MATALPCRRSNCWIWIIGSFLRPSPAKLLIHHLSGQNTGENELKHASIHTTLTNTFKFNCAHDFEGRTWEGHIHMGWSKHTTPQNKGRPHPGRTHAYGLVQTCYHPQNKWFPCGSKGSQITGANLAETRQAARPKAIEGASRTTTWSTRNLIRGLGV